MNIVTKRLPHSSLLFRPRTECKAYGNVRIASIASMRPGEEEFPFQHLKPT